MDDAQGYLTQINTMRDRLSLAERGLDSITSRDDWDKLKATVMVDLLKSQQLTNDLLAKMSLGIPIDSPGVGDYPQYNVKVFALDSARDKERIRGMPGQILVANTDGSLDDCYVRVEKVTNDEIPLGRFNPYKHPRGFSELWLTTDAQAGKTLWLLIGRGDADVTTTSGDLALKSQLPEDLTTAGNLKMSLEEQAIVLGVDVQSSYWLDTHVVYTPAVDTFWCPETGYLDMTGFSGLEGFIYCEESAGVGVETINVELWVSFDATNFYQMSDYDLGNGNINRDEWTMTDWVFVRMPPYVKAKIIVAVDVPDALEFGVIRHTGM